MNYQKIRIFLLFLCLHTTIFYSMEEGSAVEIENCTQKIANHSLESAPSYHPYITALLILDSTTKNHTARQHESFTVIEARALALTSLNAHMLNQYTSNIFRLYLQSQKINAQHEIVNKAMRKPSLLSFLQSKKVNLHTILHELKKDLFFADHQDYLENNKILEFKIDQDDNAISLLTIEEPEALASFFEFILIEENKETNTANIKEILEQLHA